MAGQPTKVYPLARAANGLPLGGNTGVPHVTTEFASKAEADDFLAGPGAGAFTLNPSDPNRVPAAEANQPAAPASSEE